MNISTFVGIELVIFSVAASIIGLHLYGRILDAHVRKDIKFCVLGDVLVAWPIIGTIYRWNVGVGPLVAMFFLYIGAAGGVTGYHKWLLIGTGIAQIICWIWFCVDQSMSEDDEELEEHHYDRYPREII